MKNRQSNEIYFCRNIPFVPNIRQIIYIEKEQNIAINEYITNHYSEIKELFESNGYQFFYIPISYNVISLRQYMQYRDPSFPDDEIIDVSLDNSLLLPYLMPDQEVCPAFIRYKKCIIKEQEPIDDFWLEYDRRVYSDNHIIEGYSFSYFKIEDFNEDTFFSLIKYYISRIYICNILDFAPLYSATIEEDPDLFERESKKMIEDIRSRIDILRGNGITDLVLKKILFSPSYKLSSLVISTDYRILLPEFNNKEIKMTPLPKSVFLLFLRHPEGIAFKELYKYKDELMQIYGRISGRTELSDMEQSILDVVDPTNNSINEKCARIREAFIREFDDNVACNYYITGSRAHPKRIVLNPELVKWQTK